MIKSKDFECTSCKNSFEEWLDIPYGVSEKIFIDKIISVGCSFCKSPDTIILKINGPKIIDVKDSTAPSSKFSKTN